MSLRVNSLNADASFMLQFSHDNIAQPSSNTKSAQHVLNIIIDPWLQGSSTILHRYFSDVRQVVPKTLPSLQSLPPPDIVIISQAKPDHCNKATLTQLPAAGGGFILLAEPVAAKLIRSWKHFAQDTVISLPVYKGGSDSVFTMNFPRKRENCASGNLTVALLSQKRDLKGLFKAIGITFKPTVLANKYPDTLPIIPSTQKSLSVLFAPHGISISAIHPWISSHLSPQNAFPLTTLIHCFNRVTNPVYLGGTVSYGLNGASAIVKYLQPKSWISCHDGAKVLRGISNRRLKITKLSVSDVRQKILEIFSDDAGLEVIALDLGEDWCFVEEPRKEM